MGHDFATNGFIFLHISIFCASLFPYQYKYMHLPLIVLLQFHNAIVPTYRIPSMQPYEVCNSINVILLQRNHRHAHTQKDYPSSDLCTFLFICTDLQWTISDIGTFNTQKQGPHYTRKTTVVYKQSRRRISSSFFVVFFSASGVQFLLTWRWKI